MAAHNVCVTGTERKSVCTKTTCLRSPVHPMVMRRMITVLSVVRSLTCIAIVTGATVAVTRLKKAVIDCYTS